MTPPAACAARCSAAAGASSCVRQPWCCRSSSSCWRCFVVPIGAMLVARRDRHRYRAASCPRVTAALQHWDGRDLPPEAAYAALIDDIRAAREAGTLASAATRLNYDVAGFRSLLFATGRQSAGDADGLRARCARSRIDPKWGERETWAVIRRAGGPVTDFYLLARARPAARRRRCDRRRAARAGGVSRRARPHAVDLRRGDARLPAARLSGRVLHRAHSRRGARPCCCSSCCCRSGLRCWCARVAWVVLLQQRGHPQQPAPVARASSNEPLRMIFNRFAVYVAMVHVLLPFMVLPLYSGDEGHPAVVRARRVVAGRSARSPRSGASTCRRRCPASAPAA